MNINLNVKQVHMFFSKIYSVRLLKKHTTIIVLKLIYSPRQRVQQLQKEELVNFK